MSTYLVAFIVSDYEVVELDGSNSGTRVAPNEVAHRVYATREFIGNGDGEYAVSCSKTALDAIADFVGVEYTLEKMDQVAIPEDYFGAGAMENWGLVTYR